MTTTHVDAEFVAEDAQPAETGSALALQPDYALPSVTPAQAREAMQQYQQLCESVLSDDDYQEFSQKKKIAGQWITEVKKFKKKSAVKKLQTFFSVEVVIRDIQRDDLGDGHFGFRVIATARHKSGRVVEASGGCSTLEERFDVTPYDNESDAKFEARARKARARSYHDVLSTAETRATNRAVMNAIGVGGGEVTADEMQRDRGHQNRAEKPAPRNARPAAQQPARQPEPLDRERYRKRLFAKLNELAELNPKYVGLKDDERRHAALEQLYAHGSLNDLTDEQLLDFERRVTSYIAKEQEAASHADSADQ